MLCNPTYISNCLNMLHILMTYLTLNLIWIQKSKIFAIFMLRALLFRKNAHKRNEAYSKRGYDRKPFRWPQGILQYALPLRCHTHVCSGDKNPKPNNRENPPTQGADIPPNKAPRSNVFRSFLRAFLVSTSMVSAPGQLSMPGRYIGEMRNWKNKCRIGSRGEGGADFFCIHFLI